MKKIIFLLFTFSISTGIKAQQTISKNQNIIGCTVKIKSTYSNKIAQVGYASKDNGALIYTYNDGDFAHFNWKVLDGSNNGTIKFSNQNSGKCLAVHGGLAAAGTNILQYEDNGGEEFKWRLSWINDNSFKLINAKSGKPMAIEGGSRGDAKILQADDNNQEYIVWQLVTVGNCGGDASSCVNTKFIPSVNGFQFRNDFENKRYEGISFSINGRCAGMVYSALDYFKSNQPIPTETNVPYEGSVLSTYISYRHSNEFSIMSYLDKYVEFAVNPFGWRSTEFFNWGLQGFGGGQFQSLKAKLDNGEPVPITLLNPYDLYYHHVVLAIGYCANGYNGDLGNNKSQLRIKIYDPNYPGEIKTLVPNVEKSLYRYEGSHYNDNKANSNEWRAYFVHNNYTSIVPGENLGNTNCKTRPTLPSLNRRGQTLNRTDFRCLSAENVDFYGATIGQVDFSYALLKNGTFYGANCRHANFSGSDLTNTDFTGADLKSASFYLTFASASNFSGADIKNARFLSSDLRNSRFMGADLAGACVAGCSFNGANCTNASFNNSDCKSADFTGAQLDGANFSGANLYGAIFTNANITARTNFAGALNKDKAIGLSR